MRISYRSLISVHPVLAATWPPASCQTIQRGHWNKFLPRSCRIAIYLRNAANLLDQIYQIFTGLTPAPTSTNTGPPTASHLSPPTTTQSRCLVFSASIFEHDLPRANVLAALPHPVHMGYCMCDCRGHFREYALPPYPSCRLPDGLQPWWHSWRPAPALMIRSTTGHRGPVFPAFALPNRPPPTLHPCPIRNPEHLWLHWTIHLPRVGHRLSPAPPDSTNLHQTANTSAIREFGHSTWSLAEHYQSLLSLDDVYYLRGLHMLDTFLLLTREGAIRQKRGWVKKQENDHTAK